MPARLASRLTVALLQVEQISHDCLLSEEAFQKVNRPVQIDLQRASTLRFGDPQVQALYNVMLLFQLLPTGFSNRNIRDNLAPVLGLQPAELTQGRMTYQLRLHGMILRSGLGAILPELSAPNTNLRRCFDKLDQELHAWTEKTKLAA